MKTPEQWVFEATFPPKELGSVPDNWKGISYSYMPLELEKMVRQAIQQGREEALEEAACILDVFHDKCILNENKEKAFEHLLTAADIRALKTKKV